MKIYCCTENRRNLIRLFTNLNGIDYLEVVPTEVEADKQRILKIQFLKNLENPILPENIYLSIEDDLSEIVASEIIESTDNSITFRLTDYGGFFIYKLHLLNSWEEKEYLSEFDKLLSSIEFSFKVECSTDLDCKSEEEDCSDEVNDQIKGINYLAKDYASFRQLILDRMALLAPDWQEKNPADLGMTLVELLAYVGDYLSYRQDAITTEAYLRTARKRISVRRHARLIDYHMHEGVNARTWIHLDVAEDSDGQWIRKIDANDFHTKFITGNNLKDKEALILNEEQFMKIHMNEQIIFEPIHDLQLFHAHNSMSFHNYGDIECCLPKGTTEASLIGKLEHLKVNDVLIFQEISGPNTGSASDANPSHRHAIKITEIEFSSDFNFSANPATVLDITIIRWSEEDALPFPLCITSRVSTDERAEVLEISVALGNNVLADHGLTLSDSAQINTEFPFENIQGSLYPVKVPDGKYNFVSENTKHCTDARVKPVPPRYNPMVNAGPLTHSQKLNFTNSDASDLDLSASRLLHQELFEALPNIELTEVVDTGDGFEILADKWIAVNDLLIDSASLDQHFVVENDDKNRSFLRFGNNINGKFPESGSKLLAEFRVGNGSTGNVGRDTLKHIVTTDTSLKFASITNPLPASGGQEPESLEEVKQYAPQAFRTQERAVTIQDYEDVSRRCKKDIQSVSASLRWTGSWHTAFVTADRIGGKKVTPNWEKELRDCLQTYRLTGLDLEVDDPQYVGIELSLKVCITPQSFKIDVLREIRNQLSNKTRNGRNGFFHPDNLVFGQKLFLSELYAIVQKIPGVKSVDIFRFQRYGLPDTSGLSSGKLVFDKKEIPALNNDFNRKDMGILTIEMEGGR